MVQKEGELKEVCSVCLKRQRCVALALPLKTEKQQPLEIMFIKPDVEGATGRLLMGSLRGRRVFLHRAPSAGPAEHAARCIDMSVIDAISCRREATTGRLQPYFHTAVMKSCRQMCQSIQTASHRPLILTVGNLFSSRNGKSTKTRHSPPHSSVNSNFVCLLLVFFHLKRISGRICCQKRKEIQEDDSSYHSYSSRFL